MATTTTTTTKPSEIANRVTSMQFKLGEDGVVYLEMPTNLPALSTVAKVKTLPTPPRDINAEMTAAQEQLHTIAHQSMQWKEIPPTFSHLIVHNNAEYKLLRNARAILAANSEQFLEKMDENLVRSIPKSKKSSFFGHKKPKA